MFYTFLLVLRFPENHDYIYVNAAQKKGHKNITFAEKFPELETYVFWFSGFLHLAERFPVSGGFEVEKPTEINLPIH